MTAWQPRRESVVRSHAVSRRSASSSCISLRFCAPSRIITWQVVHAQLPPQACSSGTWRFFATSRNDSGLPWCEYGSLPCSNSTTVGSPSMIKVTLGICFRSPERLALLLRPQGSRSLFGLEARAPLHVVDRLPGQRRFYGSVHHDFCQVLCRVVERMRPL